MLVVLSDVIFSFSKKMMYFSKKSDIIFCVYLAKFCIWSFKRMNICSHFLKKHNSQKVSHYSAKKKETYTLQVFISSDTTWYTHIYIYVYIHTLYLRWNNFTKHRVLCCCCFFFFFPFQKSRNYRVYVTWDKMR